MMVFIYGRFFSRKKTTQLVLPPNVIQPLDFNQKFLMNMHEHGIWTIVTTSILRTNVKLIKFHVTKTAMHLMEKYSPLRACIYRSTKNSAESYLVKLYPQHLIDAVVVEVQNKNWKLVMESELLKQFNSGTGPLWSISFLSQIDYEKSATSNGESQSKSEPEGNVSESGYSHRLEQAKLDQRYTSALIFRFHHSIIDGTSRTRVVGDALNFLEHILSERPIPRECALLYGPITQYLPKLSCKEAMLFRLTVLFGYIAFLRMNTNTTSNSYVERMGAEILRDTSVVKRTRIIPMEWNEENTRHLIAACKRHNSTVQGAVQTAVGIAMVEIMCKGRQDFRQKLNMLVTVNLRPHLNYLAKDAFGTYNGSIVITDTYSVGMGNEQFWKLARKKQLYHQAEDKKWRTVSV